MNHSPPTGAIPGASYNQRNNMGRKRFEAGDEGRGVESAIMGGGKLGIEHRSPNTRDWTTENQLNFATKKVDFNANHSPAPSQHQKFDLVAGKASGQIYARNASSIDRFAVKEDASTRASGRKIVSTAQPGTYNPIQGAYKADTFKAVGPDSRRGKVYSGPSITEASHPIDINNPPKPQNPHASITLGSPSRRN